MKTQRIRVLKNFWHQNKEVGADSVLDVDLPLAIDLQASRKAEFVQADTKLAEVAPKAKVRKPSEGDRLSRLEGLVEKLVEITAGGASGKRAKADA